MQSLRFWDYVIVIGVVLGSGLIGLYQVWQAKRSKNTHEFLVANRNFGITPLVLSTVATFLAPNTMLGTPMETYSNGVQMLLTVFGLFLSHLFAVYATIPVYFRLNVSTVNQYLELRFNRFLRIFPGLLGILQTSIMMASFTYISALILSQATGLSFYAAICSLCIVCIIYSSFGGFAAVIWTDVFQMIIIILSLLAVAVKGTLYVGSIGYIWEKNRQGNRTTFFHMESKSDSNYTMWSLLFGNYFLYLGIAVITQSALQRQMANKVLYKAQMTVVWTMVVMIIVSAIVTWIGMIIYARYAGCDPFMNKEIESRDQIAALFAMEIFQDTDGMFGLFIGGILATTLSTLSSMLNSISAVVLVDFVKPIYPDISDRASTIFSKLLGCLYGGLVVALTGVVQHFGGVVQVLHAVAGTTLGPTLGIFLLGFFVPWANSKGTSISYFCGLAVGWWASVGRILLQAPYVSAILTTDECTTAPSLILNETINFPSTNLEMALVNITSVLHSDKVENAFFLYKLIPLWYAIMTMTVVVVLGIVFSFITGHQDPEKLDPNLISPLFWDILYFVPFCIRRKIGFKTWKPKAT